ncbi:leucyl aminopeptidase [Marinicella gelatinilytica]|uniref:leucyl aminopeptidase n=1 Tax=Marinicella gelatinilytica TaxID=2996017 RepID=UPI002260E46D|nr:leucyl aminopeptidase [Marinicella gelatinilytica]MCX7544102.1 leucyl aminopeptidase [Marinicella gelatinilytica]
MSLHATEQTPHQNKADQIIIGLFQDQKSNKLTEQLSDVSQKQLADRIKHKDFSGQSGQQVTLYNDNGQQVLLVGLGKNDDFSADDLYDTTHKVISTTAGSRCTSVAVYLQAVDFKHIDKQQATKLVTLAASHATYRYEDTKSFKDDNKHALDRIEIFTDKDNAEAFRLAAGISKGINATRHLGNYPPNLCTPKYIAKYATDIAHGHDKCDIDILDKKQMKKMGMGALLAVAQGSHNKPRMVVLTYNGADNNKDPIALVGKGITFDTGGISLKPGANMDEMKYDMCGAASVIGAFVAAVELNLPINLKVFVPAVENMPDGKAYRPGDVITSYSGQTIEVLNTDAEGRMILCDTLTYAQEFNPEVIVDLATLTGACVVALGHNAAAVMTKTDGMAEEFKQAGEQIHDRVWELPLWDVYQKQLDTSFADMKNIGGMPAGTITAGCFLSRFTKDQKWAHIDIAGVAWKDKKEGATGRPVAMLVQYLINKSRA